METHNSHNHLLYENEGENQIRLNLFVYLVASFIFLALFYFYKKFKRKLKLKHRFNMTGSKEYLGFEDLPAIKTWIPGKLIGNLPQFLPVSDIHITAEKWSKEYGDIFTGKGLNQRFVSFNSGPCLQALMKSSEFGHLKKAPLLYNPMKPFIINGLLVSQGVFWQQQRKLMMRTQSFQALREYIPMIEKHCKKLVQELEKLFEDGECHQINGLISTTFLRIISEMISGKNLEESNELELYHQNFIIWKEVMFKRVLNPFLLLKPIWMLHPLHKKHCQAEKDLFEFAKRRLMEHKEKRTTSKTECGGLDANISNSEPKFRTMLDELLDAGAEEGQIVDEINTMMFGGHETGACAIHFFCFSMALNLEIQKRARQEVDIFFEKCLHHKGDHLTYESVQGNLKYVERCILETLRLFPPVFLMARKLESPIEIDFNDKPLVVPAGITAMICPFVLHRREKYFPNPYKFDPDRFLPEEMAKRHTYSFIPFSSGPRNCLGQKFAMMEMKIMVAYILRSFELETPDKLEDIPLLPYTTITPARDFYFSVKNRCST